MQLVTTKGPRSRLLFRNEYNVVPLPYRGVSVQPYQGSMTEEGIAAHFRGREAYRRTEFVVLCAPGGEHAVIAIDVADRNPLFSAITHVEVLALPQSCVYVHDPETDCGNRSALAALAAKHDVGEDRTLICEGKFDHVNFIHRPRPLIVTVVEVTPPEPPKLFELIRHVLSYADLPPIIPVLERIELKDLAQSQKPRAFLVPCRSGGLDDLGAPVHFLDERPPKREDWMLIGCERSLQFHRHYYGDEPPRVEMCPHALARKRNKPTILKCCLLEFDMEQDGETMVVPWGADLPMVERALRALADRAGKERRLNGQESAWRGVWSLDAIVNRRIPRPRTSGVTMVIDTGLGISAMRDILYLAGDHIDQWKFGFGTTALMPRAALEAKLALLREYDILSYPGGTLLEAAVVQEHCRVFMTRAAELGFGAAEISEGTIDLPGERRRRMIDCARNAGLIPITEVGRKDPTRQPEAAELAEQALLDLSWGAAWVIVEGRESGKGVGIYDRGGDIRSSFLDEVTRLVGDAAPRLIWEAPLRQQQAHLVCRFGANVSLGNIPPQECLALEALRCGLRFETFAAVARHSREAGRWDPARIENHPPNGLGGKA